MHGCGANHVAKRLGRLFPCNSLLPPRVYRNGNLMISERKARHWVVFCMDNLRCAIGQKECIVWDRGHSNRNRNQYSQLVCQMLRFIQHGCGDKKKQHVVCKDSAARVFVPISDDRCIRRKPHSSLNVNCPGISLGSIVGYLWFQGGQDGLAVATKSAALRLYWEWITRGIVMEIFPRLLEDVLGQEACNCNGLIDFLSSVPRISLFS